MTQIKPYLFKSLRNHITDSISLRKTYITINEGFEHPFEITYSHEDFLITQQVTEETRLKVIEPLNTLTIRQRETIYPRYFEDFDFETIAIFMDMNVQSVRNLLFRRMKAEYSPDGVHPNLKGYKVMDAMVEKGIAKALKIKW